MKKNYPRIESWSEKVKLELFEKYLKAYVKILSWDKRKVYIDLFAGPGRYQSKDGKVVDGSPLIALNITPSFSRYFFCDCEDTEIRSLEALMEESDKQKKVSIKKVDANVYVKELITSFKSDDSVFVFLDPNGLELHFSTIKAFFKKKRVDFLINFSMMGINRNRNRKESSETIDSFFGNKKWRFIVEDYEKKRLGMVEFKSKILELYTRPLGENGFLWVSKPVRNTKGAPLYDLIFASRSLTANKVMRDVMIEDNPQQSIWEVPDILSEKILKKYKNTTLTLEQILKQMLTGNNNYRVKDFQKALGILESGGSLERIVLRSKRVKRFDPDEEFRLIYKQED